MMTIGIAACGTGGHIYAAKALGDFAHSEYHQNIFYFTGTRPLDYQLFAGEKNVVHLNSKTIVGKKILGLISSLYHNVRVFFQTLHLIKKEKITTLIGLGGHIGGPVLIAGWFQRIPIFIIEQNSVMGMTNKILSFFCKKIFTHFPQTHKLPSFSFIQKKIIVSGNPIRKEFWTLPKNTNKEKDVINILVFGGSLGSNQINDLLVDYLHQYNLVDIRLNIHHQNDPKKDLDLHFHHKNIHYTRFPFFEKIWEEYAWADCVIARSGASTCSEMYFVQKPILFIPYPHHKDKHQYFNAQLFKIRTTGLVWIEDVDKLRENKYRLLDEFIQKVRDHSMDSFCDVHFEIPQKIIMEEVNCEKNMYRV